MQKGEAFDDGVVVWQERRSLVDRPSCLHQ
jgi:hypothetical protein